MRSRRHAGAAQPGVDGTARTDLRASRRVPRRRRLGPSRPRGERCQPRTSALRDIDLLAGAFPASQPQVRQLLGEQIDNYTATEWPQMSAGQATLAGGGAQLVEAQSLVLSLPIATDASGWLRTSSSRRSIGHWRLGARAWR